MRKAPTRRSFMMGLPASAIGSGMVVAAGGGAKSRVVSVADYGATPGAEDVSAGVREAIAHLPRQGGATLVFPKGEYRFAPATEVALRLEGIERLTVEGEGAMLKFAGATVPFVVSDCDGLTVRGIAVDWDRPPFSQGDVVASDGHIVTIHIDKEFPVDGSEKVQAITTHERSTGLVTLKGLDTYDVVERATLTDPQILQLNLRRYVPFRAGDVLVLRHKVYGTNVLNITRCSEVRIEDVAVFAAPGMALLAAECTNVSVDRFHVEPSPGTSRLMSTCADAVHIYACRDTISVRDCTMRGMGDDCINVHGRFLEVVVREDDRTLLVDRSEHRAFEHRDLAPHGEHFEFVAGRTLRSLGAREIVSAEPGRYQRLRFKADLPAVVGTGDLLYDADEVPRVTISGCRFPGNRGRGVLVHRNAIIEDCVFSGQFYEAILVLSDASIMEGPTVADVSVARNTVRGAVRAGTQRGAIRVGALLTAHDGSQVPSPEIVNNAIKIVGNTIAESGAAAIEVGDTIDATIASNRIAGQRGPAITLQNVRGIKVTGNNCTPAAAIVIKDTPPGEVLLSANSGLFRSK